ncbi:MAG: hypothetical protein HKP30_10465, partial [Myxococcales bacterium]|nr:hypothetical protein [Myxococcales bacterium]
MKRALALSFAAFVLGCGGEDLAVGEIAGAARPDAVQAQAAARQTRAAAALGASEPRPILFGDLHVHTSFSIDSFVFQL